MEGYKTRMKIKLNYWIEQYVKELKGKHKLEKKPSKMKKRQSKLDENTSDLQIAYEKQQIRA